MLFVYARELRSRLRLRVACHSSCAICVGVSTVSGVALFSLAASQVKLVFDRGLYVCADRELRNPAFANADYESKVDTRPLSNVFTASARVRPARRGAQLLYVLN